jgi:hypothetical protein
MWTLYNSDRVPASYLICLHVKCHGTVGGFVAFATQFLGPCFTYNTVIIDYGEFLASNTDNYSNFIGRASSTENNKIMEFIPS